MEKSVLVQKSVRDNNEDLMNFMRDLKHWETDMKRKDAELGSNKEPKEFLPPVRSKRKKEKKSPVLNGSKEEADKPKRISSFDYKSWEKFDVEKACEEVDVADKIKNHESDSDSENEDETELLRQQAMFQKGIGNECVKKEKWKEAIEHYTNAIKCFDKDAIFYANRALCYLKTNQFTTAEADCNEALKLDPQYVKAFQRRAAARISLKKFKEAECDLTTIINLEPNNKQAKRDLEKLKIDGKLPKECQQKIEPVKTVNSKTRTSKLGDINDKFVDASSKSNSSSTKKTCEEMQQFPWDPVDPARIIEAVNKPPHTRSKKPLRRIEITDKSFINDVSSEDKEKCVSGVHKAIDVSVQSKKDFENSVSVKNFAEKTLHEDSISEKVPAKGSDIVVSKTSPLTEPSTSIEVPPPARTSVQFSLAFRRLKSRPDLLYQYLKSIDGRKFPSIFLDALESDEFSCIVNILKTEFIKHGTPVLSYLIGLTNIRRFEMLALFMNKQDKEGIEKLLNYCLEREEIKDNDVLYLRKKFMLPN